MLGWLFGKRNEKPVKINLSSVIDTLQRRHWEIDYTSENVVVVKGKYRNYQRDNSKLFLHFVGGMVQFKDEYGRYITHCQSIVPMNQMFYTLKNIMNVL
ncbi:hypothetical protein NDS46_31335 (plasmid) [Paenibacillus thiaminolyticus]|uniref:hypothetical protein n=1 Tax=Paenibacillus thiaminolyticus TaxID=49283 RepID=UPI00232EDFC9|nr:hypothetical protein [Paenibacillus thiaminolyticus]WCF11452.1 hypothetical protein NDS46_31335 [Paenibacillus thiaminolyticus]